MEHSGQSRRTWRWAYPALVGVVLLASFLPLRLARAGQADTLPKMPPPTVRDRLLVIAPHCDDETLGPGGLIARTLAAGGKVRVVVVTNGDGFHHGAVELLREERVPPVGYMQMGLDRQAETVAAMARLGVNRKAISFLGYPDGGTAAMWLKYWDSSQPYTSPQTLEDHSPYENAFTRDAPYAGRSVIDDLRRIITEFRPTAIALPHPSDEHPDHWAASCYTVSALYELGQLDRVRLDYYLIHRGEWPQPRGLHPRLSLLPPEELMLRTGRWRALRLGAAAEQAKARAIAQYRSQTMVMRGFLFSFARRDEPFGTAPFGMLPMVAPGAIRVDGDPQDWSGVAPAVRDPREQEAFLPASLDLGDVQVAFDGQRLLLWVELWDKPDPEAQYLVETHPLAPGEVGPPANFALDSGVSTPGTDAAFGPHSIEISLPAARVVGPSGVMVAVATRHGTTPVDRTEWVLLRRTENAPGGRP